MVKSSVHPKSMEKLIETIDKNQSRIMFLVRDYQTEMAIRNANEHSINDVLHKYPPSYASETADLYNLNVSKLLTEQPIVLILAEDDALQTWINWKNTGLCCELVVFFSCPTTSHANGLPNVWYCSKYKVTEKLLLFRVLPHLLTYSRKGRHCELQFASANLS